MNLEPTLAKLLEAWQDGGLSEPEQAELLSELDSSPELRRRFAEQVAMLGAVRAASEQNPRWLALFDLIEQPLENAGESDRISFEAATMARIAPARPWHKVPALWALAAAVILLLAGPFWLKPKWVNEPGQSATVSVDPASRAMAVVVGASPDAGTAVGTYLKPGVLSQATGWMTLQTLTGVSVTFDAPFRVELINPERVHLTEGRARVRVPEGAEGFTLDSPAFDVVDLGTEFAALVKPDGTGTCRVFEGKADVSLLDSVGEVKISQRLNANESVMVIPSKQDMRLIEEVNADYPEIKNPPRPLLTLPPFYEAEMMTMGPLAYWRFEEIKNQVVPGEVAESANLQVAGTASIAKESGLNHSGALTQHKQTEFFHITGKISPMLRGDFSISLFAQFEWLQNFALFTATRYDEKVEGNSFILQSYSSFRRSGLNGTGLHAVVADPPAWDGGDEVYGNTLLRPQYWHHIAATRKGDQLTLYLDGVMVGREPTGSMPLNFRDLFVGRLNGNSEHTRQQARGLVGHIDELAVFPRALTDAEISKLATIER